MKCFVNKKSVFSGAGILRVTLVAACVFPFQRSFGSSLRAGSRSRCSPCSVKNLQKSSQKLLTVKQVFLIFHSIIISLGDFMKCFVNKTSVLSGAGILFITLVVSCAFPFQSAEVAGLSDISERLAFSGISRQGFMGGSVLYNPDQPSSGQLVEGAHVAVRLGYVTAKTVDAGQIVFNDDAERAEFGVLTITGIDKTQIAFKTTRYDAHGIYRGEAAHTLLQGERVDINGDGCADLEYKKPAKPHAGFENAVYLTFLSSQETLNTAMFAVLQEQYSRSVYPSGIIGINPAGQFIYSKYESGSGNRAALSGIQKGDVVLDGATGKYQKISRPTSQRGARAVNESELEDIDESGVQFSVLFSADDFVDTDAAEALFAALPETLKSKAAGDNVIDKLNALLASADFIPLLAPHIAPDSELGATAAELGAAAASLPALSEEERMQSNRAFLEMAFPELCPSMAARGDGFASVVPLASVIIDSGVPEEEAEDIGNSRAATQADYNREKAAINAKFAAYKEVVSYSLALPLETLPLAVQNELKDSYLRGALKVAIKGSFNNTWGNISGSVEGVAYITADVKIDASKLAKNIAKEIGNIDIDQFTIPKTDLFSVSDIYKNLVRKPLPYGLSAKAIEYNKDIPVVCFGPITLNVRFGIGPNLYFKTNVGATVTAEGSVTALFGGRGEVGINYGVSWKPILKIFGRTILSIPVPYVSPYVGSGSVSANSYNMSVDITETGLAYFGMVNLSAYGELALTPAVHGTIGANISRIVGIDLGLEYGVELSAKPSFATGYHPATGINFPTIKLPVEASHVPTLYVRPWVGFSVPVIGFIGYEKQYNLWSAKSLIGRTTWSKTFGAEECWALLKKGLDRFGAWSELEKIVGKNIVRDLKAGKFSGQNALALLTSYIPFEKLLKLARGGGVL
jgi:hypothetical protein